MHLTRQHRRFRVADLHGTLQFAHPAVVLDLSRSGIAVRDEPTRYNSRAETGC
jgi:hypothetical protein